MNKPSFSIGQKVYHILPESSVGVVIDIQYNYATDVYLYQVAFCESTESLFYHGHELSLNKVW